MSEYDPVGGPAGAGDDQLERVRALFERASRPYLSSPWSWLAWALVLPGAALATRRVAAGGGAAGVLLLWSGAILLGGAVELGGILRRRVEASSLGSWALHIQGNLSLVAAALSGVLVWQDQTWMLPGLWLLLLGHSLYVLGGLAFPPFRRTGVLYQLAALAAFWPRLDPLAVFAAAAGAGNLYLALAILRQRRAQARADVSGPYHPNR